MPWNNPAWSWGELIVLMLFWLAALIFTWFAMNEILRDEVGIERAVEINKQTPRWKKLFHVNYKQYIQYTKMGFSVLRVQFYVGSILLVLLPIFYSFFLDDLGFISILLVIGMSALAAFASGMMTKDDNDIDRLNTSGEPKEITQARVYMNTDWEKFQKAKQDWKRQQYTADRKEQLKRLDVLESTASMAESSLRRYYAYWDTRRSKSAQKARDARVDELHDSFLLIDKTRKRLGTGACSSTNILSSLFIYAEEFCTNYRVEKRKFRQAEPKDKQKQLKKMFNEVEMFAYAVVNCWIANENIGRKIDDELLESRDKALTLLDEIEALQKQIKHPEIDAKLREIYVHIQTNDILPPEREGHFPDAVRPGEIHRFYNYS